MDANVYHHHNGHNTTLHTPTRKQQPLSTPTSNAASLNDRLNTSYIDIAPDDSSLCASLTRFIVDAVGTLITPRQMLGVLRVLKAITLSFLILTIAADLMYICLLEIFSTETIRKQVGGSRDTIIRIYGLLLSFLAIGVEFDIGKISKNFLGLKGFIPRGMLLFFIATLTRAHPIADSFTNAGSSSNKSGNDDDLYAAADDNAATDDYTYKMQQEAAELPYSAIAFQQVTSYVLGLCAVAYFVFGLLCFDRFTSKAFLSTKNPLITTAIPQPNGAPVNMPAPVYREGSHPDASTTYSEEESGEMT